MFRCFSGKRPRKRVKSTLLELDQNPTFVGFFVTSMIAKLNVIGNSKNIIA